MSEKTYEDERSGSRNIGHKVLDTKKFEDDGEENALVMTSETNAFVKSNQGRILVSEVFDEYPYIVNSLKNKGIDYIDEIPMDSDSLVKIRGIGKKSAELILETLQ